MNKDMLKLSGISKLEYVSLFTVVFARTKILIQRLELSLNLIILDLTLIFLCHMYDQI